MANLDNLSLFVSRISSWYKSNSRPLPWRVNPTPYHIWLAEVIFQQTRIEQGLEYYHRFLNKYPDVEALSKAADDEVLKLWQGLGYYSRALNLLKTARIITSEGGVFPSDVEKLKKLPGIGPYTAGAIASIAFGKKEPLVDGNVQRVFSRFFGIEAPVNEVKSQKIYYRLAEEIISRADDPSVHNQGLMDFGSLVCKPKKPKCHSCILSDQCKAYLLGKVNEYPVKINKDDKVDRYFIYGLCQSSNLIAVHKRHKKDIWKNLYQLPLLADSFDGALAEQYIDRNQLRHCLFRINHQLTHQRLHIQIYPVEEKYLNANKIEYTNINKEAIIELAFPVPLAKFLSAIL